MKRKSTRQKPGPASKKAEMREKELEVVSASVPGKRTRSAKETKDIEAAAPTEKTPPSKEGNKAKDNSVTRDLRSIGMEGVDGPSKQKGQSVERENLTSKPSGSSSSTSPNNKKKNKKNKANDDEVEQPQAEDIKFVPKEDFYVTIRYCVLCETNLKGHKKAWEPDLQKRFESFCTFLNIELDDRHSWDYPQENFPFCSDCTSLLDYLHVLYGQLEVLHGNVALGVRKIRQIVSRTTKNPGDTGSKPVGSFGGLVKSQKSLEYRVKFVRGQILTAMGEESDDEEIVLPGINDIVPAGKSSAETVASEPDPAPESDVQVVGGTAETGTPRFEIIPVKVDNNVDLPSTATNGVPVPTVETGTQTDVLQVPTATVSDDERPSRQDEDDDIQITDESETEGNSNPVDEFQAFIEEQLEKRRQAALRAQNAYTPIGETREARPKPAKKAANVRKEVVVDVEDNPVDDPIPATPATDEYESQPNGTMEFFEEKPVIDSENIPIPITDSLAPPRRSVRPKKRVKYSKQEYVLHSDEEGPDEDFDVTEEQDVYEGDSDDDGEDKRPRRARRRGRATKASVPVADKGEETGENQSKSAEVVLDDDDDVIEILEEKGPHVADKPDQSDSGNVLVVESLTVKHDSVSEL